MEDYAAALDRHICAPVTFTDTRRSRSAVHRVELGTMNVDEITEPDIRLWVNGMLQKPDARRKGETVLISSSSVNANLRILTAVLNFAVAQGYLDINPAANVSITIHGARQPEWFRTSADFWAALAHIDERWDGALHDILVMLAYSGLRVNEGAALRDTDPDLTHHRVMIRHNLDRKGRASTVKTELSEDWMPLHPEAETALRHALDSRPVGTPTGHLTSSRGGGLVFRGPRGGRIGSSLINDALTYGCAHAGLPYRVTVHGLRHSMANWLKAVGVPTRDIQAALRHADARTTGRYLHTSAEEKTHAINQLPGRPSASH